MIKLSAMFPNLINLPKIKSNTAYCEQASNDSAGTKSSLMSSNVFILV